MIHPSALQPGSVLDGKWRLEGTLGEGGMGKVLSAHDLALDRQVAVKVLSENLARLPDVVARFEREARLTASLEHPNVVPIYAVGRVEELPYFVMKKLEGRTLSGMLFEKGALSQPEVLSLMRQLCAGLQFIHAKGCVHRDIKAANIFVGHDGHATLLDFGILRDTKSEGITRPGVVMGTPQYMSPEQAKGLSDVDHRADLYALAVVLYQCLAGALPFDGVSDLAIVQMQAHAPPPDLAQQVPGLNPQVAQVVRRGLAKNREDRFGSAQELLLALEAAFAGQVPIPLTQVEGRGRRWKVFAGAAVLLGSLAGGALLLTGGKELGAEPSAKRPLKRRPPPERPEPEQRPELAPALLPAPVAAAPPPSAPTPTQIPTPTQLPTPTRTPTPAPVAAVPGVAPAPARSARVERRGPGKVNIVTTHRGEAYWASVSINGARRGNTPLTVDLPAGQHRVRLERTGFRPVERQIKVAAGGQSVLKVELRP